MSALLKHLEWLDDQAPLMLSLVEELCNQNSGTTNLGGLQNVATRLTGLFSQLKGDMEVLDSGTYSELSDEGIVLEHGLGQMVRISKWPKAKRRVALCIHMDTVYSANHPFQKCQRLPNGYLNGPGVADAKGGLVVMLHALLALERSPLAGQLGWDVLINADEEIGSPGSAAMIESLARKCDFGLLFEPTLPDGTMVSWRKGSGSFNFIVRGRSAHAGRDFENGRNAIVAAAKLATAVSALNTDPEVTFNVGKISGGGPLNMVPALAILRINVRVKTVEQQAFLENQLADLAEVAGREDGIAVELMGEFSSPPKPLSPDVDELKRQIESAGRLVGVNVRWQGTGGTCDGNKFASFGLPNIDTLGPCGGSIHSPDEFLIPESLVPRTKLAATVLLLEAMRLRNS